MGSVHWRAISDAFAYGERDSSLVVALNATLIPKINCGDRIWLCQPLN
jgi:hypothetical protein